MIFLLVNLLLFVVIIFLFIILSWVWPPDSPWAPWWKTDKKKSREVCRLAKVGSGDVMYELGSGNGTTLIIAVSEFDAKKAVGIEIDPLRVVVAKYFVWYHKLTSKIIIKRKNFFTEDITDATVVYCYLIPRVLKKLEKKFKKELKPGTRIISYVYPIDYLPLIKEDKKNRLFLYRVS